MLIPYIPSIAEDPLSKILPSLKPPLLPPSHQPPISPPFPSLPSTGPPLPLLQPLGVVAGMPHSGLWVGWPASTAAAPPMAAIASRRLGPVAHPPKRDLGFAPALPSSKPVMSSLWTGPQILRLV
jgi:hypothetical protein